MYILVMLNVDDNRLSEDQKQLVSAFNAAAEYFKDRLLGKASLTGTESTIEDLTHSHKGEQANSAIAGEALEILTGLDVDQPQQYYQALKRGGTTTDLARYFIEEVQIVSSDQNKKSMAEAARANVLKELLLESVSRETLPKEYTLNALQGLGLKFS